MQGNKRLSSTEISNLWTHYIRETLAVCVSKYMIKTIRDDEINHICKLALEMSLQHIAFLRDLFHRENFPVPQGFSEEDVNLDAPSLFTDKYCLQYMLTMSMHGAQGYSTAICVSFRKDIRDFYYQCNLDTMDLYNKCVDVSYMKNLIDEPSSYASPDIVEYINDISYVTDVFGKQRSMNSIESGNIFFNLNKSVVAKAFFLAGQQVCKDKDILEFLEKCIKTANNHIGTFTKLLIKENLTLSQTLDKEITISTVSPFSEKLILFQSGFFLAAAITYYGTAAIASMRADLSLFCEKAILEDLLMYSNFGKLMIQKGWAEQPPYANDRSYSL